ncbi:MAG: hypothetical protein PW843_06675 [Azospirillaceae bacterium]|nr:hypothetical protein [Azospirillaceae bacterium]
MSHPPEDRGNSTAAGAHPGGDDNASPPGRAHKTEQWAADRAGIADRTLSKAAEMLSGIRGTKAYANATPVERQELESYIRDLADTRANPPDGRPRPNRLHDS